MEKPLQKLKENCIIVGKGNSNIQTILLVGSYSRNEQKTDSDIDVMIITNNKREMVESHEWINIFGNIKQCTQEEWGVVTSLRVFTDEFEYEFGIGNLDWIQMPLDKGTERTLTDGYTIFYEINNCMKEIAGIIKERKMA